MIQGKEIKFDVKVGGGFNLLLLSTRNSNKWKGSSHGKIGRGAIVGLFSGQGKSRVAE